MMMRKACGNTTSRITYQGFRPSARAASRWSSPTARNPARTISGTYAPSLSPSTNMARDFFGIAFLHHDLVAHDYIGDEVRNLRALGGYIEAAYTSVDTGTEQCGNDTLELHAHHIRG